MNSRQHIRALCELHGYASVLDDVRAALECSRGAFREKNYHDEAMSCTEAIRSLESTIELVERRIPIER